MENILDFTNAALQLLSLHKVGNKSKGEELFLSQELYEPSDEQREELLSYFLVPFKNVTTVYKFQHSTDIEYNEVHGYSSKIFNRKDTCM